MLNLIIVFVFCVLLQTPVTTNKQTMGWTTMRMFLHHAKRLEPDNGEILAVLPEPL